MDRRPLHDIASFDEIVYEYDKKHSQLLVYIALSRVILMRYVDHGTYYNFILKNLKNTGHFSYTNCSLNTNI